MLVSDKSMVELQNLLEEAARPSNPSNLSFVASVLLEDDLYFEEAKLCAYTYRPRSFNVHYHAFARLSYGASSGSTEQADLATALATLVAAVNHRKIYIDTLLVWSPDLLSSDAALYHSTKMVLTELFSTTSTTNGEDTTPGEVRTSLFRQRLGLDGSLVPSNWNALAPALRKMSAWHGTDLRNSSISGINFNGLDFSHSLFQNSNMTKASCGNAILLEGQFENANLNDADLEEANAENANFSGASLKKAKLTKATLVGSQFRGANLTKAKLNGADLRGADFTDATLDDCNCKGAVYDERTKLPAGFEQSGKLVWEGDGPDPYKLATRAQLLSSEVVVSDFQSFLERLGNEFDSERVKKALAMLKKEKFQLFSEVSDTNLIGVVQSQTDPNLVYACQLVADGRFSCCTQNLYPCGGLRGALCKHLLVLTLGLVNAGQLDPMDCLRWVLASRLGEKPKLNADRMTSVFLKYKSAQAGEIDWRPTETIPEDYYAY